MAKGLGNIMKQAQQMQAQMLEAQEQRQVWRAFGVEAAFAPQPSQSAAGFSARSFSGSGCWASGSSPISP